jgi:hypothetical protein
MPGLIERFGKLDAAEERAAQNSNLTVFGEDIVIPGKTEETPKVVKRYYVGTIEAARITISEQQGGALYERIRDTVVAGYADIDIGVVPGQHEWTTYQVTITLIFANLTSPIPCIELEVACRILVQTTPPLFWLR